MLKSDLKYLLAYFPMCLAYWGLNTGGIWTFSAVVLAFVIVPVLEGLLPFSEKNVPVNFENKRHNLFIFDLLLYLNLPLLIGLIVYYFEIIHAGQSTTTELVGMSLSVGVIVGTIGINVAHEIGHRDNPFDQFVARALLLSALYQHFNIEHNLGHHKNVATEKDPSSARLGENLYSFWIRAVWGAYLGAWQLERSRLNRAGQPFWSLGNKMILFTLCQFAYLLIVGWVYGAYMIGFALAIAVFGFLLLETVNYIEHYGLSRKKLASGRYEIVLPRHSWNSNHEVGRILLYELTRHSDHHYKASRKYQILRHMDESPQLPMGYPTAMLLSLLPPLWFSVMDARAKAAAELGS